MERVRLITSFPFWFIWWQETVPSGCYGSNAPPPPPAHPLLPSSPSQPNDLKECSTHILISFPTTLWLSPLNSDPCLITPLSH